MQPTDGFDADADVPLTPGFETFARATFPRLVAICWVLTGNRRAAERAARATLAQLHRQWTESEPRRDEDTEARRLALRRVARTLRRPSSGRDIDDELPDRELWHELARLPRRQRSILALHYVDDLPLSEVASVLGEPPGTVSQRHTAAIDRLDRRLTAGSAPPGFAGPPGPDGGPAGGDAPTASRGRDHTATRGPSDLSDSSGANAEDGLGMGLADPTEDEQRREGLDARLRTSGATVRDAGPRAENMAAEFRELSAAATSPQRRHRILIGGATALATLIAVPLVAWLAGVGDDDGGSDATAELSDDDSRTPATSGAATTADTGTERNDESDTDNSDDDRVERLDAPGDDLTYHFDMGSNYLITTTQWNWDDDGGACVAISRPSRTPDLDRRNLPDDLAGCVPGSRSGVPLIARFGDDLIGLRLPDARHESWELDTEPSPPLEDCGRSDAATDLEPGRLYELACRNSAGRPAPDTQIRRFPLETSRDTWLTSAAGDEVLATHVGDGDELDVPDPTSVGSGVDVYRVAAGSHAKNAEPCVVATVPEVAGWREACTPLDGRFVLGFNDDDRPYLIDHDDTGLRVVLSNERMGGSSIGCAGGLSEVLGAGDDVGMWTSFGCDGATGTGVRAATSLTRPPHDPRHEHGEVWIGEDKGQAAEVADGRPSRTEWVEVSREPDLGPAWRCGELAPCGGVAVLPLRGSGSGHLAQGGRVDTITGAARDAAGGASDPGSIGVAIGDELVVPPRGGSPGAGGASTTDAAVFSHRGHDYRWVTVRRWNEVTGEPGDMVGVWTVRLDGRDSWSVAAAFRFGQ